MIKLLVVYLVHSFCHLSINLHMYLFYKSQEFLYHPFYLISILIATSIMINSFSIPHIFFPMTIISICIAKYKKAMPFHFSVFPRTMIIITIDIITLAFSFPSIIFPASCVFVTRIIIHYTFSIKFSLNKISNVSISIGKEFSTFPM